MSEHKDILQIISNEEILKLKELYKQYFPRTIYVYNFLNSAMKWKVRFPDKHYVTIMAPHGNWQNGTFVALHQYFGYEIFMSTLDESYEILTEIISNTKNVDWNKRMLLYAVHSDHRATILKALSKKNFEISSEISCKVWWMPANKALQLKVDCAPEIYVSKLDKSHAGIVNSHWPHKFDGSEKYVAFIIEMNGGYGVFLKNSNKLIAWTLRIQIGLGMLHVVEEYKRKGYGSLVTKVLAKQIAQEGIDPLATVVINNKAGQATFSKVGFEQADAVSYIESKGNELI